MNQNTSFQQKSPVEKIAVLWITAGLGCDGESVALTAASQPSIEDIVLGGMPGFLECVSSIPFIVMRTATSTPSCSRVRNPRKIRDPIHPGHRRLDSERGDQGGRILGGLVDGPQDRPTDDDLRMDRPPGAEGVGGDRRRNLRGLWRYSRDGRKPDGRDGLARLPREGLEDRAGASRSSACPGVRRSPTTSRRRFSTSCIRRRSGLR